MIQQFPLHLSQTRCPLFENFIVSGNNREAVAALVNAVNSDLATYIYLWGSDCGKSHLLMSACAAAENLGGSAIYLPLREIGSFPPDALEALEQYHLIALDDIDAVCGDDAWEIALFNLYNRVQARNGTLLVSASSSPATLDVNLPDLASRLMSGTTYRLDSLDDQGFTELLKQIAREKGMAISDEIANYLVTRYSRSAKELVRLMDQLDEFSLEQKKKITIPLLRQWLSLADPSSASSTSSP